MTGTDTAHRLCLGTNVLGWHVAEDAAHDILDAYRARGGDFIDTADNYSVWVEGNPGGISESIIGNWLADRGVRDSIVLATKIGQMPDFPGYEDDVVHRGVEESLRRLRTDYVDIIYAHRDHDTRPLAEIARVFHELVAEGRARRIGLSNYGPDRVREWLDVCAAEGLTAPSVVQPHYNLMEREHVETGLAELALERGLDIVSYAGLARGFLTGRYRGADGAGSPRAAQAQAYSGDRGDRVLAALDEVAARHAVEPTSVAIAWLLAKPAVTSTIVSVSRPAQLDAVFAGSTLSLSPAEVAELDRASGG